MTHKVNTKWLSDMSFDSEVSGHHVTIDASAEVGGKDSGPRPKELMLTALAGCTAMDVISILKKMKVEPKGFHVNIEAELTEEHPKHYKSMHLIYLFEGDNLPIEKLERAVSLSQEKYCGVSFMYRQIMTLTHEIVIINPK